MSNETREQLESFFSELIESKREDLLKMAFSQLRDPSDAEDAVQEAMLSALRNLDQLSDAHKMWEWIKRILYNETCNILRRNSKYENDCISELLEETLSYSGSFFNTEKRILLEEEIDELKEAISGLSPGYAEIIKMHALGFSTEEIRRRLAIDEHNRAIRLYRARKLLNSLLNNRYK